MTKRPTYLFDPNVFRLFISSIQKAEKLILFLDYDGTLTSIRPTPQEAVLSPQMAQLLKKIHKVPATEVVISTGRALKDIRTKVGRMKWIVANHGYVIKGKGVLWVHPEAIHFARKRYKIIQILNNTLSRFNGVIIEDKMYSVCIHYRKVSEKRVKTLRRILLQAIKPFSSLFRVQKGKKVIELRPDVEWGKGNAIDKVLSIMRLSNKPLLLAIGDDITDESMFQRVNAKGYAIRVGRSSRTNAQYFVRSPQEVGTLLETIFEGRSTKEFKL